MPSESNAPQDAQAQSSRLSRLDDRARAFSQTLIGRWLLLTLMFWCMSVPGFFAGAIAASRQIHAQMQCQPR